MGVTLDLRMIDHEHVVESGLRVVNDAISRNDPAVLVEYILSLPFEPNLDVIAFRKSRCDKLRELNAPQVILDNEERFLRFVTGEFYSFAHLSTLTFDELRELLGTWRWVEYSFSVDKRWWDLEWFLQPKAGNEKFPLYPIRPSVGDPEQTLFDKSLHGSQASPEDISGSPIITSCGSPEGGCFGYNPPDLVREISSTLQSVNMDAWDALIPERIDLYKREPLLTREDLDELVNREIMHAREALSIVKTAYKTAVDLGFGMAAEFCL